LLIVSVVPITMVTNKQGGIMSNTTNEQRVRIIADSDPCNPREWDNAGRMICWHNQYNLGDDHGYSCTDYVRELACEADDALEARLDRLENDVYYKLLDRAADRGYDDPHGWANDLVDAKIAGLVERAVIAGYVILPLYLYDHSGITMSTGSFGCPWDSGQVGYIICDNETVEKEFGGDRDLAEKSLRAEVSVYDDYLTGNVYGFIVEERDNDEDDDWEHVDSCWGFYGYDPRTNGMADHLGSDDLVDLAVGADIEYS